MSSGIATVMKDQTSDRLKQSSILQVLLTLAQSWTQKHVWSLTLIRSTSTPTVHRCTLCFAPQQGSRRWWWPKTCSWRSWGLDSQIFAASCLNGWSDSHLHGAAPGASFSWPVSMSSSLAFWLCVWEIVCVYVQNGASMSKKTKYCKPVVQCCSAFTASGATNIKKPLAPDIVGESPNLLRSSFSSSCAGLQSLSVFCHQKRFTNIESSCSAASRKKWYRQPNIY